MTESDAKTKWCPQARMLFFVNHDGMAASAACNVFMEADRQETRTNCIGSACMMWRTDSAANVPTGNEIVRKGLDGMSRFEPETRVELSGHCGLASAPPMPLQFVGNNPPPRPRHKGVYNNPQPGDTDFPGG